MLDILICTMPSRVRQLNELMAALEPQVRGAPVGVLHLSDGGVMPIGAKRNALLQMSTRRYVAFVDDDDMVDTQYVSLILEAAEKGPDCVGICGHIIKSGQLGWQFRHSITVGHWCKDKKSHIYFRTPNHLNPIKRDIAVAVGFPPQSWGEDRVFSERVRPFLHSEIFIERPLYFYKMNNKG